MSLLFRIRRFHVILLVHVAFAFHLGATSQPSYFFLGAEQFDGVDIYDVIQDKNLNYWIATEDGLYRFDNYGYTRVDCFGMKGPAVFGFLSGKDGRIYCHNLNQQIFQIVDDRCLLLYELSKDEISSDLYLGLTADSSLLVLCRKPFALHPETNKKTSQFTTDGYHGFPFYCADGRVISHVGNTDTVLICSNSGFSYARLTAASPIKGVLKFLRMNGEVLAVNVNSNTFYRFDEHSYTLITHNVQPLINTSEYFRFYTVKDRLWIAGARNGVYILPALTQSISGYHHFTDRIISEVYTDHEENILLGTFGTGILVIPDLELEGTIALPGGAAVLSIASDPRSGIITGAADGRLYSYIDHTFSPLNEQAPRPLQSVFTWEQCPFILFDDGDFSAGGNVKIVNKSDKRIKPLGIGALKDAAFKQDGTVYLAMNIGLSVLSWTNSGDVSIVPHPDLHIRCHSVSYASATGFAGIATSNGLKLLDDNNVFKDVMYNGQPVFTTCTGASEEYIYAGHTSNQLLKINSSGDVQLIELEGFNDEVFSKIEIYEDRMYVLGSKSLFIYTHDGKLYQRLNPSGIASHESINDFCIAGNDLWIGHSSGLQRFALNDKSAAPPVPLIGFSLITVDSDTFNPATSGEFGSSNRKFRFVLSSPTLRNTESIRYHYMLEGIDTGWTTAAYRDHELVYQSLAPGTYTMIVKAENNGTFSEAIRYNFVVTGPFWTSVWFYAGCTFFLALTITLVYRNRLRTQQRKARLVNELLASRLTAIQSQMNPHFIFNSLNSIQDLVLKGDVDNSYTFITKFSNLVRRTLNYSDKDFVEFSQEIKLLELYLSLEKLRFKDDLEFTLETNGIDDILLPPMLIQPFIENSLVHGLLHKEGKKRLHISFVLKENLTCIIEDNGIGREKAKEIKSRQRAEHESFSGEAIKKRFSILSRIFKSELGYVYEDMYDSNLPVGTRVKLTIPVKRNF